jgi:hypothetical protein
MNGLIEGYIGTEGSGKTTLMTYYSIRAAKKGIKIFAFPGYDLKDKHGNIVSERLTPQDFLDHFEAFNNCLVDIDEITNFGIDAYAFNGTLPRMFGYAAAMRRKLSLSILYTVQNFSYIPPRIRFFTHTLMFCRDMYFGRQFSKDPLPRGEQILCRRMDMKGFYTGKEGWLSLPKIFFSKGVWKNFETQAIVDPRWGLKKYQFEKETISVGGQSNPQGFQLPPGIESREDFLKQNLSDLTLPEYRLSNQERDQLISDWVQQVRDMGICQLSSDLVMSKIKALGIPDDNRTIGRILRQNGAVYLKKGTDYVYQFDGS